jgi:hypothetical protein
MHTGMNSPEEEWCLTLQVKCFAAVVLQDTEIPLHEVTALS